MPDRGVTRGCWRPGQLMASQLPAPGRSMHAALQVLQAQQRAAETARPESAGASRQNHRFDFS